MAQRHPSERRQLAVLLEHLQSQLQVVAEGHGGLEAQITALDQKVTALDQKVDHGFATLGQRIGFVEAAVLDVRGEIRSLDQRFDEHLSPHAA